MALIKIYANTYISIYFRQPIAYACFIFNIFYYKIIMNVRNDLSKISEITENLFLSGIFPLDEKQNIIKKMNIKYILSCVDRNFVSEVHDKIMIDNPDIKILYLPYNDEISQNLWTANKNQINITKYTTSMDDYDKLKNQLIFYNNKPMIEIGYHFINSAIESNSNVLVHCMGGISRSVSMVIYYFMKKYCINFDEASKLVKRKRIIANPNDSFKCQLIEYQNKRDKFTETDAKNSIIRTLKRTKI